MYSDTSWTLFLEPGNAEKMLKARTIDNTFWHYLKRCSWSWNSGQSQKKQGRKIVHSGAICNNVFEVWNDEKILKAWTQNSAFWRYLKLYFGSWNCWENVESKEAKWCILTLFETMFWKFEMLRIFFKMQGRKKVHSDASWNAFWKL